MSFMSRRNVIPLPIEHGAALMAGVLEAYNIGYPIVAVFEKAGLEFTELFHANDLHVFHDFDYRSGAEQITIHNGNSSFAFIRPNGVVMVTFKNNNAIQRYEGKGIIDVVTKLGSKRQNRRLYLSPETLQPYFMNDEECR